MLRQFDINRMRSKVTELAVNEFRDEILTIDNMILLSLRINCNIGSLLIKNSTIGTLIVDASIYDRVLIENSTVKIIEKFNIKSDIKKIELINVKLINPIEDKLRCCMTIEGRVNILTIHNKIFNNKYKIFNTLIYYCLDILNLNTCVVDNLDISNIDKAVVRNSIVLRINKGNCSLDIDNKYYE
jgi:hypothetical protein